MPAARCEPAPPRVGDLTRRRLEDAGRWTRPWFAEPGVSLIRRGGRVRHPGAVPDRRRLNRIPGAPLLHAGTDSEHQRRLITAGDDRVRGSGRAVDKVPRAQRSLLALDDQGAGAMQHEKVLLSGFVVV